MQALKRHSHIFVLAALALLVGYFLLLARDAVRGTAPLFIFFLGALILAWRGVSQRRWLSAIVWAAAGIVWIYYYHDTNKWLLSLGTDSFAETTAPTLEETLFWLKTMAKVLTPALEPKFALICVAGGVLLVALIEGAAWLNNLHGGRHWRRTSWFALALVLASTVSLFARSALAVVENSALQEQITRNFRPPSTLAAKGQRPFNIVVYIGEATTMMNWELYGYPRATTPKLSAIAAQDPGLLAFRNVYSTHTHTMQSLLEALSIEAKTGEDDVPITERHRVSVIDVLSAAGVRTALYSNQGQGGTFNLMSPVIFGSSPQFYSTDSRAAGNMDTNLDKPFDDAYFDAHALDLLGKNEPPTVTFLHSNAGHGPYLDRIPPAFRPPVDRVFAGASEEAVIGDGKGPFTDVEAYDSAMAYVDHSISQVITKVAAVPAPTILVYFSDHGEAPSDSRGHESSRLLYEMMRVPFLVYFNPAARTADPALFETYKGLATSGKTATLGQVPATLFDLLGVKITGGLEGADEGALPVVGGAGRLAPILVRILSSGATTEIDLDPQAQRPAARTFDADSVTVAYLAGRRLKGAGACYGGANSFIAARRGSLVAGCLGLDLDLSSGTPQIANGPAPVAGLGLVLKVASASNSALWLRLRGGSAAACAALKAGLAAEGDVGPVLAEVDLSQAWAASCAAALQQSGVEVAATFAGPAIGACAEAIGASQAAAGSEACGKATAMLESIKRAETSIVVSPQSLRVLSALPAVPGLRIHLRGYRPTTAGADVPDVNGYVMITAGDPNSRSAGQ